ncbi:MAG: DUF167 domain-containing protein [Dehalococcoidia bacterium]|jgi:hypothetical protein|nr:DUF167 domain-containing protein [Dehalococcoidia bacterium]
MSAARISIRLTPRASRDEVVGFEPAAGRTGGAPDVLRVRVTAPPVDGRANTALTRLLAKRLGVARRDVTVVSGQSSRQKVVAVEGLSPAEVCERLEGRGPPASRRERS